MRVWQYDPRDDALPDLVQPGDLENRRAVLLAAPEGERVARAWMAVDDYDADEATLLFAASPGDDYASYVGALLSASVEVARQLGFRRLLAHWRRAWSFASPPTFRGPPRRAERARRARRGQLAHLWVDVVRRLEVHLDE